MTTFDWQQFEESLFEEFRLALTSLGEARADDRFYVVALYHVYRELDGILSLPMLGANTVADGAADPNGDFHSERWNPYDSVRSLAANVVAGL